MTWEMLNSDSAWTIKVMYVNDVSVWKCIFVLNKFKVWISVTKQPVNNCEIKITFNSSFWRNCNTFSLVLVALVGHFPRHYNKLSLVLMALLGHFQMGECHLFDSHHPNHLFFSSPFFHLFFYFFLFQCFCLWSFTCTWYLTCNHYSDC